MPPGQPESRWFRSGGSQRPCTSSSPSPEQCNSRRWPSTSKDRSPPQREQVSSASCSSSGMHVSDNRWANVQFRKYGKFRAGTPAIGARASAEGKKGPQRGPENVWGSTTREGDGGHASRRLTTRLREFRSLHRK